MNAVTPVQEIRHTLETMKPQFIEALPAHIKPERFIKTVQVALNNNPSLLSANRQSLYNACMSAAKDGLLPDGRESAFVMFKDQVSYMPMVAGILKKVRNSGEIATVTSQIVHEKDDFKFFVDEDGEHLRHEPNMLGDRGKIIGVYALAKTKEGELYVEVMTMDQIEAVKKTSRSQTGGPWNGPFATEMYRKTVIRRLAKRLPLSTDRENDLHLKDEEFIETESVEKQETPVENNRPNKLKDLIVEGEVSNEYK